jgi:selenocysteine-specific elongation factor
LSRSLLEHLSGLPASLLALPADVHAVPSFNDALLVADAPWKALGTRLIDALEAFHERSPDEQGPDASRLRRMAAPLVSDTLWRALVDTATARREIVRSGPWLHLPDHVVTLDAAEQSLADALLPDIGRGRFDPPWVRDLATTHGVPEERVRHLLRKLARRGELFQVVRDLFYHRDAIRELATLVTVEAHKHGGAIDAGHFRDATALGRKRAIQLLEFFDRAGYTRFHRDRHVVRTDSRWLESQS